MSNINILEEEFLYLANLWEEYKILFSNKDNIKLLNSISGNCFYTIQCSMNNDIILSINRLLDPSKQSKNKNLTLETLIDAISEQEDQKKLFILLKDIRNIQKTSDLKFIRHKKLAHSDSSTRKKDGKFIITLMNYDVIEKVINLISYFLNEYHKLTTGEFVDYTQYIKDSSCEDLINICKR